MPLTLFTVQAHNHCTNSPPIVGKISEDDNEQCTHCYVCTFDGKPTIAIVGLALHFLECKLFLMVTVISYVRWRRDVCFSMILVSFIFKVY